MTNYQKANQIADQICSAPYSSVILGLLYAMAFIGGFVIYMFATDAWNLHYCLAGGLWSQI